MMGILFFYFYWEIGRGKSVSFHCGRPLSMGRAVSRFGKPAGSHPARYSHKSRAASVALHSLMIDRFPMNLTGLCRTSSHS